MLWKISLMKIFVKAVKMFQRHSSLSDRDVDFRPVVSLKKGSARSRIVFGIAFVKSCFWLLLVQQVLCLLGGISFLFWEKGL